MRVQDKKAAVSDVLPAACERRADNPMEMSRAGCAIALRFGNMNERVYDARLQRGE
jgi:hypothetical protein